MADIKPCGKTDTSQSTIRVGKESERSQPGESLLQLHHAIHHNREWLKLVVNKCHNLAKAIPEQADACQQPSANQQAKIKVQQKGRVKMGIETMGLAAATLLPMACKQAV